MRAFKQTPMTARRAAVQQPLVHATGSRPERRPVRPMAYVPDKTQTGQRGSAPAQPATQQPPAVKSSSTSLLVDLEKTLERNNVYGKPFSKSEQSALQELKKFLESQSGDKAQGQQEVQDYLLGLLKEASEQKKLPLPVVEGAMVLLELMYLGEAREQGAQKPEDFKGRMSKTDMLCRWQLVIGADVGAIQYIPANEQLEVFPEGTFFNLDTDLDFIFTGFSGDCKWLSPGHLQYNVRNVKIEFRQPKAWRRNQILSEWRNKLQAEGKPVEGEPDYGDAAPGADTCRPDPKAPSVKLPLPFPQNELFIFCSNGELGVLRSKLGGLILLVNRTPADKRKSLAA